MPTYSSGGNAPIVAVEIAKTGSQNPPFVRSNAWVERLHGKVFETFRNCGYPATSTH